MTTIADVLEDPAASHWLKSALRTALERDCVDAAEEAVVLAELLGARADSILAGDPHEMSSPRPPERSHA